MITGNDILKNPKKDYDKEEIKSLATSCQDIIETAKKRLKLNPKDDNAKWKKEFYEKVLIKIEENNHIK